MALSEQRILKSVEVLPSQSSINTLWVDQILRDGEVVAETNHRKAYSTEQKDEFRAEVEGAENYISAVGWAT